MSLSSSIVVKTGATAATLTGGTDTTFINDGQGVNGAKVLVDSSNGSLLTRRKIITRVVNAAAAPNANALAKLGKSQVTAHSPYVDGNNKSYKLPDSFEMTYHPSQSQADRITKFWNFIAIIIDSELANLTQNLVND